MSQPLSITEMMRLSVAERIELVEDIWDSIAEVPESVELSDDEKKLLNSRLISYRNDPNSGSPWSDVKARIRGNA